MPDPACLAKVLATMVFGSEDSQDEWERQWGVKETLEVYVRQVSATSECYNVTQMTTYIPSSVYSATSKSAAPCTSVKKSRRRLLTSPY